MSPNDSRLDLDLHLCAECLTKVDPSCQGPAVANQMPNDTAANYSHRQQSAYDAYNELEIETDRNVTVVEPFDFQSQVGWFPPFSEYSGEEQVQPYQSFDTADDYGWNTPQATRSTISTKPYHNDTPDAWVVRRKIPSEQSGPTMQSPASIAAPVKLAPSPIQVRNRLAPSTKVSVSGSDDQVSTPQTDSLNVLEPPEEPKPPSIKFPWWYGYKCLPTAEQLERANTLPANMLRDVPFADEQPEYASSRIPLREIHRPSE